MSLRSSRLGFKSRPGRSVFARKMYVGAQSNIAKVPALNGVSYCTPMRPYLGLSIRWEVHVETVAKGF